MFTRFAKVCLWIVVVGVVILAFAAAGEAEEPIVFFSGFAGSAVQRIRSL